MASRKDSDEFYVIDLCDKILGQQALRQHTFDFLRGDGNPGRKLPVDAYYPALNLVIEYRERQHTESVAFFNRKETVSGVSRDEQRRIYDQRRRDVLPKHGIRLIEISYSDLNHDSRKRLTRNRTSDISALKRILGKDNNDANLSEISNQKPVLMNRQPQRKFTGETMRTITNQDSWAYRLYKKNGCLFIAAVIISTLFLSVWVCVNVFHLDEGMTFVLTFVILCLVGGVGHQLTTAKELQEQDREKATLQDIDTCVDDTDILCWQCGSSLIDVDKKGNCTCLNCGFIFKPQ